jgi:hypothetical protein
MSGTADGELFASLSLEYTGDAACRKQSASGGELPDVPRAQQQLVARDFRFGRRFA